MRKTRITRRTVAEHLETEHHEATYTQENAMWVLPKVVRANRELRLLARKERSSQLHLAELTTQCIKVVLTGEGVDEIFAEHLGGMDLEDTIGCFATA